MGWLVLKTILILGLMIAVMIIFAKYGNRLLSFMPSVKNNRGKRLKLVESLPLEAGKCLYIISIDGQEHLFSSGPNGLTCVSEIPVIVKENTLESTNQVTSREEIEK
ncbi:hypothetical protein KKD49_09040 [Myxococcota bacterium]|nr:hypothetical protein [Myxococcota bacterium]